MLGVRLVTSQDAAQSKKSKKQFYAKSLRTSAEKYWQIEMCLALYAAYMKSDRLQENNWSRVGKEEEKRIRNETILKCKKRMK